MSKQNETIAEKMARLNEMVAWFESDDFAIESAMGRFAEAEALAKEIETELSEMKNEITVIKERFDVE